MAPTVAKKAIFGWSQIVTPVAAPSTASMRVTPLALDNACSTCQELRVLQMSVSCYPLGAHRGKKRANCPTIKESATRLRAEKE